MLDWRKISALLWAGALGLAAGAAPGLLTNGSFENGAEGWSNVDGDKNRVERSFGRNQSGGLRYHRDNPADYRLVRTRLAPPRPGTRYRFGAWIRPENLKGFANIAIEVSRKGEYLYGAYAPNLSGDSEEWQLLESSFSSQGEDPAECTYVLTLYLRPDATGTAYFDDVFLLEDVGEWLLAQTWPSHRTISAQTGEIELNSYCFGEVAPAGTPLQIRLALTRDGATLAEMTVPVSGPSVRAAFGPQEPGPARLEAALLTGDAVAVARRELEVEVVPAATVIGENSCGIDAMGRAIVDGKPFMPLGLFAGKLTPADLDIIAAGPFNCVMPYAAMEEDQPMDEIMDALAARNLKIIFSLKDVFEPGISVGSITRWRGVEGADAIVAAAVERYRHHPALLAWYICDESPRETLPRLLERRRQVNALDPDHPTWAVFYQMTEIPHYLESCDVLGVDPYPVMNAKPGNLQLVDQMGRQTSGLTAPVWAVPQIHNLGNYDAAAVGDLNVYQRNYRYPSEEEMLAISLLEAIYGAKGFVLYSYFDLFDGPDPEQFERRWPEVCRVAEKLAGLQTFLLSDTAASAVKVTETSGTVRARIFTDGAGNYRMLVVGCASGSNRAELELGGLKLSGSTTGRTRMEDGICVFSGDHMVCDIVELKK